jgi:hypothetical protein
MKKAIRYLITTLLCCAMLMPAACAGSENDPEIIDTEKDVQVLTNYTGGFANALFRNVDLLAGWFYEDSAKPENIYLTIKLRGLRFGFFNTSYGVGWEFEGKSWAVVAQQSLFKRQIKAWVGYDLEQKVTICAVTDAKSNTITFTIPKKDIMSPAAGETLNGICAAAFSLPNHRDLLPKNMGIAYDEALTFSSYTVQY